MHIGTLPGRLTAALAFVIAALPTLPAQRPAAERQRPATTMVGNRRGPAWSTRSTSYGQRGMAATSHPLATNVALDVLKAGGSAVDAAIAANALLGLVEPTGNGMGGDLFAIVWDPESGRLHGYNGSGRSPKGQSLADLKEQLGDAESLPAYGVLPITVPGCVDGWFALHGRFGRLPMDEVLAPAVRYCRQGAPITPVIAGYWRFARRQGRRFPDFGKVFAPGGEVPGAGDLFRNPALGRTLERIGKGGRETFYQGEIAKELVAYLQAKGSAFTLEDFANHQGEWVDPVSTDYRGYDVWELPPNGQGIAALQILNLIEPYDVAAMGFGSADWIHLFTEAKKLAFEDRARFYGDMAMADVPLTGLISKDYAKERGKLLDMAKAAASFPVGNPNLKEGDTIYLTVADSSGMMVSWIQSNYRGFGSGVTPPELGFCLQDRGQLFDLTPGRPNSYAPGKRPFHTIIPAFVTKDGKPWMSFGVMGGAVQPQGHVQMLVNMIDFGMDPQAAGDAPRIVHEGSSQPTGEAMTDGGILNLERGLHPDVLEALRQRGHTIRIGRGSYGGYQGIIRNPVTGVYAGATEMRKDGIALGY